MLTKGPLGTCQYSRYQFNFLFPWAEDEFEWNHLQFPGTLCFLEFHTFYYHYSLICVKWKTKAVLYILLPMPIVLKGNCCYSRIGARLLVMLIVISAIFVGRETLLQILYLKQACLGKKSWELRQWLSFIKETMVAYPLKRKNRYEQWLVVYFPYIFKTVNNIYYSDYILFIFPTKTFMCVHIQEALPCVLDDCSVLMVLQKSVIKVISHFSCSCCCRNQLWYSC